MEAKVTASQREATRRLIAKIMETQRAYGRADQKGDAEFRERFYQRNPDLRKGATR